MPPMILCVTANPIPENRLDELPLEVRVEPLTFLVIQSHQNYVGC